jgi:hypothetical protein
VPFGDVLDLADEVDRGAVTCADERDAQEDPDQVAPLVEVPLLHLVRPNLAVQHLANETEVGFEVLRVGDVLKRPGEQLVVRVADELAERVVHPQEAAVGANQRHADRGEAERAAELLLALAQRLRGTRAVAHVGDDTEHGLGAAVELEQARPELDRNTTAVARQEHRFVGRVVGLPQPPPELLDGFLTRLGRDQIERRHALELLRCVAGEPLAGGVDGGEPALEVDRADHAIHVLEQQAVTLVPDSAP